MQKTQRQDQAAKSSKSVKTHTLRPESDRLLPLSAGLGPKFAALEAQAAAAISLLDRVRQALPEAEGSHLISASYHDDTLVLTTDSSAWGTRLRYQEEAIRNALTARGEKPFTVLKVRVGQP